MTEWEDVAEGVLGLMFAILLMAVLCLLGLYVANGGCQ